MPDHIAILEQGPIVADSLVDYLLRHPEMEIKCSRGGSRRYLSTESTDNFESLAGIFMGSSIIAEKIQL